MQESTSAGTCLSVERLTESGGFEEPTVPMVNDGEAYVRIADLADWMGSEIEGQYLLVDAQDVDGSFLPYAEVRLADATGSATGLIWSDRAPGVVLPNIGTAVRVVGLVYERNGEPQLDIRVLESLPSDCVEPATDLLLDLPQESAGALRALETSLPRVLRRFLARVLLDPAIWPAFATCRASEQHHHADRGGLLRHSLENVDLIAAVVERTLPRDAMSVGVAQLGYLLHDVGKIRTVGASQRPALSWAVRHETHNLLVLAPHLAWLREARPEIHAALVYVLEYVATPAPARKRSQYFPAEVVATFDGWSAARHTARGLGPFLHVAPRSRSHRRLGLARSSYVESTKADSRPSVPCTVPRLA